MATRDIATLLDATWRGEVEEVERFVTELDALNVDADVEAKKLASKEYMRCFPSELRVNALCVAAAHGQQESLRTLLRLGADADYVCPTTGSTPLHLAARGGGASCCGILRAAGAQVSVRDRNGDSPLIAAAATGNLSSVQLILSLCEDTVSWYCARCSATHTSNSGCEMGTKMTSESFIPKENTKALHAPNRTGTTPAMVAAANAHAEVLAALLAHPSFAEAGGMGAADNDGCTVLHHAAKGGSEACIELLLAAPDVPITVKDKKKMTAQDVALKTAGSSGCAAAIAAHLDAERAKGDDFLRELLKEQDTISLSKSKSKKKKRAKGAGGVPGGGKDMCEKGRVVDLLGPVPGDQDQFGADHREDEEEEDVRGRMDDRDHQSAENEIQRQVSVAISRTAADAIHARHEFSRCIGVRIQSVAEFPCQEQHQSKETNMNQHEITDKMLPACLTHTPTKQTNVSR